MSPLPESYELADDQGVYEQHGWTRYPHPERMMTRDDPEVYR